MPNSQTLREGHMWNRTFRKFDSQEGMVFCRLVGCNTRVIRKLSKNKALYFLHGLYLLPIDTRGCTGWKLQKYLSEGFLFAKTSKDCEEKG